MTVVDILTSSGTYPERPLRWPVTSTMLADASVLAHRVTQLLASYLGHALGKPTTEQPPESEPRISSGYRPAQVNALTGQAAKHSNHIVCRAVDLTDPDGKLADWCLANLDLLEHFQLWLEAPKYTKGWVHLQSVPPKSNHRVFVP